MNDITLGFILGSSIWPFIFFFIKFPELIINLIDKWIDKGEPITQEDISDWGI